MIIEPLPVAVPGAVEDPETEYIDAQEDDPTLGMAYDPATGEFIDHEDQ